MAESNGAFYGSKIQKEPAVKEVHVLWITAGLSCDGDSVSVTAASQPSIEVSVMGAIPGLRGENIEVNENLNLPLKEVVPCRE